MKLNTVVVVEVEESFDICYPIHIEVFYHRGIYVKANTSLRDFLVIHEINCSFPVHLMYQINYGYATQGLCHKLAHKLRSILLPLKFPRFYFP